MYGVSIKQLTVLPKIFNIDLPEDLSDEILKCKDNKEVKKVGTEWMVQQCKELMEFGAPCLHFYTMSTSDPIYDIAKELF